MHFKQRQYRLHAGFIIQLSYKNYSKKYAVYIQFMQVYSYFNADYMQNICDMSLHYMQIILRLNAYEAIFFQIFADFMQIGDYA